jgi:hypothetical protein
MWSVFSEGLICQENKDCAGTSSPKGLNDGVSQRMNVVDREGQKSATSKDGRATSFVKRARRNVCGQRWAWSVEQGEWRGQKNETGDGHPGCLCCLSSPVSADAIVFLHQTSTE